MRIVDPQLSGLFHNADSWIMPPGGTRSRVEGDKCTRSRRAASIRRRCFGRSDRSRVGQQVDGHAGFNSGRPELIVLHKPIVEFGGAAFLRITAFDVRCRRFKPRSVRAE